MATLEMTPTTPVVVTGGASGIGRGCARALAAVGRPVAVWDINGLAAEAEAEAIGKEFGVATLGAGVDVRQTDALPAAAEAARAALGTIGGLVHAAGVSGPGPIDEITEDGWDRVVDVNLRAETFLVQALLPDLRASGGAAIVGIASIAAWIGYEHIPAYCASKAGLLGLTRSLALALAGDGIRVNAVCPGYIDTPMLQERALAAPGALAHFETVVPLSRIGEPDDIAKAVRFLMSDQAGYVTGQHLVVDGGCLATTV